MSYEIGRSDVGQDRTTTLARLDWPLSLLCLINYFHRRAILVIVKQHYHISLLYVLCAERNGTTVSERSLSRVFTLNGVGTNNTISTPFYPLPTRKRPRCSSKNTRSSLQTHVPYSGGYLSLTSSWGAGRVRTSKICKRASCQSACHAEMVSFF